MITETDLKEAIAECMGEKNPNANTCVKLAAYYTIMSNLYPAEERQVMPSYSFAPAVEPVDEVTYESDTEFSRKVHGKKTDDVMAVIDDLMNALIVLNPRLYESVIDRL